MRVTRIRPSESTVRRSMWALGLGGMIVTIVLMKRLGGEAMFGRLSAIVPALPLIFLLTALRYPFQTLGWWLALNSRERPAWPQSISATLAGSAVSYLTFAGPIAGEPTRALLLRRHTDVASGIAAGAVERAVYAITGAVVTGAGFAVAAVSVGYTRHVTATSGAAVATLAVIVITGIVVVARRRPAARETAPQTAAWRETIRALWHTRRGTLALIVVAGAAQHLLLLAEAWVILHALGQPVSVATVLVFESMMKAANSLGTFVPGGVGVTEGGSALLAAGLGIGANLGLTLALVRRARALVWAAAGLTVLGISSVRVSSPGALATADARRPYALAADGRMR